MQIGKPLGRTGAGLSAVALDRSRMFDRLWPLSVVILTIGSMLLWLPYLGLPLHDDAGGYATAAYWWARGDTLYRDITITRPQGIFVVFRLIEALGLGSARGIYFVAALYSALCGLLLLAITSRVWGRGVGLGAMTLFALVMATPYVQGYSANAELFMLLPALGSLYLLLRADDYPLGDRRSAIFLAGCGLLGAIALLLKPSGVVALALAAAWLLRRRFSDRVAWRAWLRAEGVLVLSFVIGLLPAVIHGLLTVPDVYLDAVLFYRLDNDFTLAASLGYQFSNFVIVSLYLVMSLPILLLAAVGLWTISRRADTRGRDLLGLWLLTSFGGTALGGHWLPHYYQQLLPPVAVAVALAGQRVLRRPQGAADAALHGLALIGIGSLAVSIVSVLLAPADPSKLVLGYAPTLPVTSSVAAYLRDHTTPTETVYVAYSQADIYYLAQRRPATRWLYYRELQLTPGAFDEQVAQLGDPARAPRYIIAAQEFDRWGMDPHGALRAVVARDYTLETTIGGIPLYRRLDRPANPAARE